MQKILESLWFILPDTDKIHRYRYKSFCRPAHDSSVEIENSVRLEEIFRIFEFSNFDLFIIRTFERSNFRIFKFSPGCVSGGVAEIHIPKKKHPEHSIPSMQHQPLTPTPLTLKPPPTTIHKHPYPQDTSKIRKLENSNKSEFETELRVLHVCDNYTI